MKITSLKQILGLDSFFELHLVRILILISIMAGKEHKQKINGITKLVKLDFLLRYPIALERALVRLGKDTEVIKIKEHERQSVESRMIRYKYGPWDKRYRLFLSMLESRGMLRLVQEKETINIEITEKGYELAQSLITFPEFEEYAYRSTIIRKNFWGLSATKLKDTMYEIIPELREMKLGEIISI